MSPFALIHEFGAVSKQVARAMAEGALAPPATHVADRRHRHRRPGGGTAEKPVGLVHFAVATAEETRHLEKAFGPNWSRDQIRQARSVVEALKLVLKAIGVARSCRSGGRPRR